MYIYIYSYSEELCFVGTLPQRLFKGLKYMVKIVFTIASMYIRSLRGHFVWHYTVVEMGLQVYTAGAGSFWNGLGRKGQWHGQKNFRVPTSC